MARSKNPLMMESAAKALRENQMVGISQTKFAANLDISLNLLHKMLNGQRGVSPENAVKLSSVLGIPVDQICAPK